MALISCPKCGNTISEYSETCPHCGHPIHAAQSGRRLRWILILSGAAAAAACVLVFLTFSGREIKKPIPQGPAPTEAVQPTAAPSLPGSPLRYSLNRTYTPNQQRVRALAEQSPLSRSEILEHLRYRENWSLSNLTYALAGCDVDWNVQAARRAVALLEADGSLTRDSLYEQLMRVGFSSAEADYGVSHCGRTWETLEI